MKTRIFLLMLLLAMPFLFFGQEQQDGKSLKRNLPEAPNFERPRPSKDHANETYDFGFLEVGIRWYAIENKDNPRYWEHVNTERVWVELEVGKSINDPEIADFLSSHSLGTVHRSSLNKQVTNYYIFELPAGTKEQVLEIVQDAINVEGVLFVEPSVIYTNYFTPNDPFWNDQWGPFAIYANFGWDWGYTNSWNVIAVLDDAIDYEHQDLGYVQYGWDYGFNDGDPYLDWNDQTHGTHVTGIIAADINDGVGIAGMVNDTVYFAKVTDFNYTPQNPVYSDGAIIDALYDIATLERVGVINMSLGGGAPSSAMEQACTQAWNAGKYLAVASGNDGTNVIAFPAAYDACTAVGSIGTDGFDFYLTLYSQYGNQQEICAPGGDAQTGFPIISTIPGNSYEGQQGTSMAAPHVAGAAGLLLNQFENNQGTIISNSQIRQYLIDTSFDFGDTGWDPLYGYGVLNGEICISVGTIEKDRSLTIFPNPAQDFLQIKLPEGSFQAEVQILDQSGRLVFSDNQYQGGQIDLYDFPVGMYIVALDLDETRYTSKLLKQ